MEDPKNLETEIGDSTERHNITTCLGSLEFKQG